MSVQPHMPAFRAAEANLVTQNAPGRGVGSSDHRQGLQQIAAEKAALRGEQLPGGAPVTQTAAPESGNPAPSLITTPIAQTSEPTPVATTGAEAQANPAASAESPTAVTTAAEIQRMVTDATRPLVDRLESIGQLFGQGRTTPFNLQADGTQRSMPAHGAGRSDGNDAALAFERMRTELQSVSVSFDPSTNRQSKYGITQIEQRDVRSLDHFVRNNRQELREGMEKIAKQAGLLRGSLVNVTPVGTGAKRQTANTDVPDLLLDYLSSVVRVSKFPMFVFRQFANTKLELGKGPGDTIKVARFPYFSRPAALSERVLTPLTNITANPRRQTEKSVKIELQELGLGADAAAGPITFATFTSSYSLLNLEQILERQLGYDYAATVDVALREQYATASTVIFNRRDQVATAANQLTAAGDGGSMTRKFLIALKAYLMEQFIPPYMQDGNHGIVMPPRALAQLLQSMTNDERFISPEQRDIATKAFSMSTGQDFETIDGYFGVHEGFHVFGSNAYGTGAAGTEGVSTVALGGALGNVTARDCYAFGSDHVARAQGLAMEVRRNVVDDFGRRNDYIWYSHEAFDELDINADAGAGTELRVVKVRTLDTPV